MTALNINAQIAVIGAGAMGAGIAQVAAQAGHPVLLLDNRPGAAAQAIEGIDRQLGKRVEKGKLSDQARLATVARLQAVDNIAALADCALIIEAIVESLEVKRALFRQLESLCGEHCMLVSNTSSLSITSIAAQLDHPQRLLGLHFFNPAPVMALVEIVCTTPQRPGAKNRYTPARRQALSSTVSPALSTPRTCVCCRKVPPTARPLMH
jgi:3-hydroxybutyryl-CoA dehydrogenase